MRAPLARSGLSAAVLVSLAACGSKDAPSAGPGSGSGGSAARPAEAVEGPRARPLTVGPSQGVLEAPRLDLPKLESLALLSAGTGPKERLRYRLADEPFDHIVETQLSSRELAPGGQLGAPVALPAIRDGFGVSHFAGQPAELGLRALPAEIAAGGASAAAPAAQAAERYVASWRAKLQNRRATIGFTDRGHLGPFRFNDDPTDARSAAAKDELSQRLLALVVPLPEEPVGAGARWEAVAILRQGPLFVKQTALYTLTHRAAGTWQIRVELRRVAEEQTVTDPALPAGASADLLAMSRRLEGELTLDPRRPFPDRGTLSITSSLHLRLRSPGRPPLEQFSEDTGTVAFSTRAR